MQELTKKIEEMLQRIEALEQRAHVKRWGRNQFDPTVIEVFFNKLLNK
jgi:hypothetical protein